MIRRQACSHWPTDRANVEAMELLKQPNVAESDSKHGSFVVVVVVGHLRMATAECSHRSSAWWRNEL